MGEGVPLPLEYGGVDTPLARHGPGICILWRDSMGSTGSNRGNRRGVGTRPGPGGGATPTPPGMWVGGWRHTPPASFPG